MSVKNMSIGLRRDLKCIFVSFPDEEFVKLVNDPEENALYMPYEVINRLVKEVEFKDTEWEAISLTTQSHMEKMQREERDKVKKKFNFDSDEDMENVKTQMKKLSSALDYLSDENNAEEFREAVKSAVKNRGLDPNKMSDQEKKDIVMSVIMERKTSNED